MKPSEIVEALGVARSTVYRWIEIAKNPEDERYSPISLEDLERHEANGRYNVSPRVLETAKRFF